MKRILLALVMVCSCLGMFAQEEMILKKKMDHESPNFKKACGSNNKCNYLCDIADVTSLLPGQCTISVATAAAIACAIYG